MTLKKIPQSVDDATADKAQDSSRMSGSRTQRDSSDSFTRRFSPEGRSTASPGLRSRSLAHRPPPLALPLPTSSVSHGTRGHFHDRDGGQNDAGDRARDDRSRTPGGTASQLVRKRPAPDDVTTPPSDFEDGIDENEIDGEVHDSRFDEPVAETPELTETPLGNDFCLCAQAPKIPRPRNVFMLYRQSHQASVVARNPGIANPDISKIIGHMWRSSDDGTKAYWRQRAEEEKQRHRELYPDYRYQPKRVKKKASSGDRPGSASSSTGGEICDKCLRPRNAPPSSARSVPSSARPTNPPPSPFVSARARASFPSPVPRQQRPPSPYGQGYSSREAVRRRPLPPHGRPSPRGQPHHYQDDDSYTPSDPSRGRFDPSTPFSAQFSSYGNEEGNFHARHGLPYRPSPYNEPRSANMPQYLTGPAPLPGSPRMRPPPPPMRHSTRPYTGHYPPPHGHDVLREPSTPLSGHPAREDGYRAGSGRLPPPTPQDTTHGYYPTPSRSGAGTPLTAGPSIRQIPTPTTVPPYYGRQGQVPGSANAINRELLLLRAHPRPTSGFTDESLTLAPLVADVPSALQATRRFSGSSYSTGQVISSSRATAGTNEPSASGHASMPAHLQDMHAFASLPTPIAAKHDGDEDRHSQASGIRAMVMSVSYLKKLEVLRRICPPRSLTPRRGPVIAIEGDNAVLREAIGRVAERILDSSGKCNVRVWTMCSPSSTEKNKTDSGMGSSVHGEDVSMAPSPESGSDCNSRRGSINNEASRPGSLSFTVNTLGDVMQLTTTWHRFSKEIFDHIRSFGRSLGSPQSTSTSTHSRKGKERATGPPSPARSPMEMQLSPTSLSPAVKNAELPDPPEDTRMSPASGDSPSPAVLSASQPAGQLLPVALLTTGYSLAISDKCAISVPIDDLYPPVAHWEHMATLWRGNVGPDLVVYVDASPAPLTIKGANGPEPCTVHYADQEGVLVVHVPLPDPSVSKNMAGTDDGNDIVSQATQRRLAYDILELVHSEKFNVVKE